MGCDGYYAPQTFKYAHEDNKKSVTHMEKKTKTRTKTDNENNEADSVDTIRDILFGNQMRGFDQKFAQLEERLASDISALRQENSRQIESLQTFIESEIDILGSKLTSEEKARVEEMDSLDSELKQTAKQLDKKIEQLKTNKHPMQQ